jgi:hypothetical protein
MNSPLVRLVALAAISFPVAACNNPVVDVTHQGSLAAGDPVYDEDQSFYDEYTFYTRAGYTITVAQLSTEFDSYTWLISPSGDSLLQVDDSAPMGAAGGATSQDALIQLEAPQTGTYTVRANSYQGGVTGAYTVRIVTTPPGGTLPQIELNMLPTGEEIIRVEEGSALPEGAVPVAAPAEGSGAAPVAAEGSAAVPAPAEGSVAAPAAPADGSVAAPAAPAEGSAAAPQ